MKLFISGCCWLTLAISTQSMSADKIYESVDEQGNRTYSDSVPADAVAAQPIAIVPAPQPEKEAEASKQQAEEAVRAADQRQMQRDREKAQKQAEQAAAQERVKAAEAGLANAKEFREGDRQGMAGGGSRIKPEYHDRVQAAERELQQAQEAAKKAGR
jgi:type IV secretory pathway VirB10-like protein